MQDEVFVQLLAVQSQRHAVYIDAHTFKQYLHKLRRRMHWGDLHDRMYDSLRVAQPRRLPADVNEAEQDQPVRPGTPPATGPTSA